MSDASRRKQVNRSGVGHEMTGSSSVGCGPDDLEWLASYQQFPAPENATHGHQGKFTHRQVQLDTEGKLGLLDQCLHVLDQRETASCSAPCGRFQGLSAIGPCGHEGIPSEFEHIATMIQDPVDEHPEDPVEDRHQPITAIVPFSRQPLRECGETG